MKLQFHTTDFEYISVLSQTKVLYRSIYASNKLSLFLGDSAPGKVRITLFLYLKKVKIWMNI